MYSYNAKVIEVVDGDTMVIDIDLGFSIHHIHKLRVAKYDAPEIFHPGSEQESSLGLKAKAHAESLLLNKNVVVNTKKTFNDKYGRYLCSITLPDGTTDFASAMIIKGFVKVTL